MFSFIQYFDVGNNDCSNHFPICIKLIFQGYISDREEADDIKINMTPYVKCKWCSDDNIFLTLLQDACSDQLLTQFQETIQLDADINKTVDILLTALGRAGDSMKVTQRKMRANYTKPQPPWLDSDCEETKVIKDRWLNKYRGSGSQRELDLYKVSREYICKHKQNTFKSKHRNDLCTSM